MGKKLIIKGADFSDVAIHIVIADITSRFSFTDNLGISGETGEPFNSTTNKWSGSNYVDISDYQGKKLKMTTVNIATSSVNGSTGWAITRTTSPFIKVIADYYGGKKGAPPEYPEDTYQTRIINIPSGYEHLYLASTWFISSDDRFGLFKVEIIE